MVLRTVITAVGLVGLLGLAGCGDMARLPLQSGTGAKPELPAPRTTLIPTVNIAPALGWPAGATPRAAPGTQVVAFASGLDHPRWLHVLPNGDVLVAESNAPARSDGPKGLRQWAMGQVMKRAGAGVPSADRITLLRDADGDGVAETRSVLLSGLRSPFGMALVGERLFVANADEVLSFPYRSGELSITAAGTRLVALPGGPVNHHWTKSLLASPDGRRLYVGVGSNSNIAEGGMAQEAGRAAVWEVDIDSGAHRIHASGLRNPVGLAWAAGTSSTPGAGVGAGATPTLWAVVNERDELGSDLVPDYLTALKPGAFYGWPYSYYGSRLDPRVPTAPPGLVESAVVPDYALGAHVAPLGLASSAGSRLPSPFIDGMFVGEHGSWNRRPHSGYKVVFVPFAGGQPAGLPLDVLSGFISPDGDDYGRPVGVALDKTGALLVADDVGNVIWRVSAQR